MLDVFQTDIPLAITDFRVSIHHHLNNLLTIVFRDQDPLFLVVWLVLAYLLLKLFSKTDRIKLTGLIIDLGIEMPGFIIRLQDLSSLLTIINCLIEIFSCQIGNSSDWDLLLISRGVRCSVVLDVLSFYLLVFIVEVPFS